MTIDARTILIYKGYMAEVYYENENVLGVVVQNTCDSLRIYCKSFELPHILDEFRKLIDDYKNHCQKYNDRPSKIPLK